MTARPIAVFQQAAILATSGQYRSADEVDREFIRRGRPQGIADLPSHQRSYVDEVCAKSSAGTIRQD